jgi:hypothetical protein
MPDMYDEIDKMSEEIEEDAVIKEIMDQYPNLYDMIDFNEYIIKDRIEKNAYVYQQFRLLCLKEKAKLHRIEILMEEYIGNLYDELKYRDDRKLTKAEIERYMIPSDAKAIKFKKLMIRQNIRVETFESIRDTFKQQGFNMNLFIKTLQD